MLALGSILFVGASAKCEMDDIMSLIAGGGDSDESRRRLMGDGLDGMFDGINQDCVPCITKCITDAIMSGNMEQGAEYYSCFFACPEREYESPCSIEDMITIQQTGESLFSDTEGLGALGGDLENFNPFSAAEGLSQECIGCQTKCLEETLVPALEALGGAIEAALSGGDGGSELDFEAEMVKYQFCSSCCVGLNMGALINPGAPPKTCKAEFQDTIPEMFVGSSKGSSGSDNTGVIVGVVVAVLVLIGLGAGVGYYYHTKKAAPEAEGPSTPMRSTGEGEEPSIAEV